VNLISRKLVEWFPAFVLFAGLLALWQISVTFFGIREYLLPSPASVWRALTSGEIRWAGHIWATSLAIFGAFVIAAVGGVLLGVIVAWSSVMNRALMPFLVFVNTLAEGGGRAAVHAVARLRHPAKHADRRADRFLPGCHQHGRWPVAD
jgi:NitT/TauT family transport system permease protein